MSNVVHLDMPPRPLRHDVTLVDLAADIRRGHITRDEMYALYLNFPAFSQWMKWRGIDVISHRLETFIGSLQHHD